MQLSLDKGQVVGLKPGAGPGLGPHQRCRAARRLALDFSDLTDKGLAFDTVRGDFDLRDGSAYTDNVLVKGPAAEIGLIGRVGLKNKDYDQTAVVTGSVGSSLPLAALAGGPGRGRGRAAFHAGVQTAAERVWHEGIIELPAVGTIRSSNGSKVQTRPPRLPRRRNRWAKLPPYK